METQTIKKLTSAGHLIDMDDIIREGNPTLREVAADVEFPLSDENIILGEKMLNFLRNSQDEVTAEKMGLRAGVGIAAPQLDVSRKIIAVLVPNAEEIEENESGEEIVIPPKEAYSLATVMYNPRVVSHSVQDAALAEGEGCLSVDRDIPGYVIRHARATIEYFDKEGNKKKIKLKGYNAIVVQHEIDHINGIMFFDRINPKNPFATTEGMLLLD